MPPKSKLMRDVTLIGARITLTDTAVRGNFRFSIYIEAPASGNLFETDYEEDHDRAIALFDEIVKEHSTALDVMKETCGKS